ncbi:hypothetical protein ACFV1L_21860 [Kitasatospora sp. NPDC059646]|uniref:hypothetical protein n=1 Tax=Kitasatospora sp. NPDC059646 TaxID=3346893 RepID=UPI00369CDBC2
MPSPGRITPPPKLVPRWRDLPRLAAVSAQAFTPAHLPPALRAAFAPVWLFNLAVQHTAGDLLAVGPSTLGVHQPRPLRWHLFGALVLLPATVAALLALLLPPAIAVKAAGDALAGPLAGTTAECAVLAAEVAAIGWQIAHFLAAARRSAELHRTITPLRQSAPWAEVAGLAGGRDGHATRALVRQTLAWADEHGLGLAAVPATDRLRRTYALGGFHPAHPGSPVLLRPPVPRVAARPGHLTPERPASTTRPGPGTTPPRPPAA